MFIISIDLFPVAKMGASLSQYQIKSVNEC